MCIRDRGYGIVLDAISAHGVQEPGPAEAGPARDRLGKAAGRCRRSRGRPEPPDESLLGEGPQVVEAPVREQAGGHDGRPDEDPDRGQRRQPAHQGNHRHRLIDPAVGEIGQGEPPRAELTGGCSDARKAGHDAKGWEAPVGLGEPPGEVETVDRGRHRRGDEDTVQGADRVTCGQVRDDDVQRGEEGQLEKGCLLYTSRCV